MRRHPMSFTLVSAVALAAGMRFVTGCAASGQGQDFESPSASGGAAATGTGGGTTTTTTSAGGGGGGIGGSPACGDVPTGLREAGVTDAQAAIFAAAPGGDSPFIFDPPSGVVLPAAWPSPSFLVHTSELPAVAQLTMSMGAVSVTYTAFPEKAPQAHAESVVSGAWWTISLPASVWKAIRCAGGGAVSYRVTHALVGASAPAGTAGGTLELLETVSKPDMTYWEIGQNGGPSGGELSIQRLAVESGAPQTLVSGKDGCVGCHTSTPDGEYVAFQTHGDPGWIVKVKQPVANADPVPPPITVLTTVAQQILDTTVLTVPTTSPGAWSDNDGRWIAAVTLEGSNGPGVQGHIALLQIDAANPSIALSPDAEPGVAGMSPATPAFSPDAKRLVYAATAHMGDGYITGSAEHTDLWQVPVTLKRDQPPVFGSPSPLPFASGNQTYPTFSRDGKLLAFMRTAPNHGCYDEETGEIWVMPADGSKAPVRIAADDAPADASVFSGQGLTCSWPRFGQTTVTTPEGAYYSLLFSSRRGSPDLWHDAGGGSVPVNGRPIAHLYLAAIRVGPSGDITSYPAALVPGQRVDAGAHTATFTTVTSVPPPPPK